jgi:hypothetical protein
LPESEKVASVSCGTVKEDSSLRAFEFHLKAFARCAVKPPAAPTFVDSFATWKEMAAHLLGAGIEGFADF